MLYPLKHGNITKYTYLNTVWAQFWRPTLTLGQKYRRLDGPRVHSRLCLLIHHCTSARFGKIHDFTVTGTRRPTGSPESRHAPPKHGWVYHGYRQCGWRDRGETDEDCKSGARGRRDLHARERESRSLNSSRCAARSAAITAESCTRRRAWLATADWRGAPWRASLHHHTRTGAHSRRPPASPLAACRHCPTPPRRPPPLCRQPNHADTPRYLAAAGHADQPIFESLIPNLTLKFHWPVKASQPGGAEYLL